MTKRALMNTNVDELLPVSGKESPFVGVAVGAATVVVGAAAVVVVVGAVVVVGSETVVAEATGVPAIEFEAGESPIAFTLLIVTE
jgi:hypothetical protein